MKRCAALLLCLGLSGSVANARPVLLPPLRQLDSEVDVVAVGKPVSTQQTGEQTTVPHIGPESIPAVGMSTEFKVRYVLKGGTNLGALVVYHLREKNTGAGAGVNGPKPSTIDPQVNGPRLFSFDPKDASSYLLFLKREPDGRYAPYDQTDPLLYSMIKLEGKHWDAMSQDDFQKWYAAQKWRNAALIQFTLSSNVPPALLSDQDSIHDAAFKGELDKVRTFLQLDPALANDTFGIRGPRNVSVTHATSDDPSPIFPAHGRTPLHVAAGFASKEMVELLLANDANIEARDNDGRTPLMSAVLGGREENVKLLLARNADIHAKDNSGKTPLTLAEESQRKALAELLRDR